MQRLGCGVHARKGGDLWFRDSESLKVCWRCAGQQRRMTLGRNDGRTLADFMPLSKPGPPQKAGRQEEAARRGANIRFTVAAGRAAGTQESPPASNADLPPHLRQQ